MGFLKLFGQKADFATKVKSALEKVQKEADKDPDTFKENIAQLEKEWAGRKDPVEQSVLHAVLGSSYKEMKWTHISDYDEETRDDYDVKRDEHFAHVLDHMEALARTKANAYSGLLEERGRDSELYGSDMLSVMIDFLKENASWTHEKEAEIYEKAFKIYLQRGNKNGYGLMKRQWLQAKRRVENQYGNLTYTEYKDSVYQLMLELKDEEVGADLALDYRHTFLNRDESILFLRWAVAHVGNSRRKDELKGELSDLERPTVNVYRRGDFLANRPYETSLSFWNCERATMTVRRYVGRRPLKNGGSELILTGPVVEQKEVVLEMDSTNRERKAKELPVEGNAKTSLTLPAGRYVFVAEGFGESSVTEFNVSTMRVIKIDKDGKNCRVYVVDNETGRPLSGVKVQWRKNLPEKAQRTDGWEGQGIEEEKVTGADGVVDLSKSGYVRAFRNEYDFTEWDHEYNYWKGNPGEEERTFCRIMTDRSIYRPGQKVMGSVVLYTQWGDKVDVLPEKQLTLTISDAMWKKLSEVEFVTNEYGTASFEYLLPEDCEVGNLHLRVNKQGVQASCDVKVEEYKRPTFEVSFGGSHMGRFGETLEAEGTAMMFAGVPVQGALVRYSVEYASVDFKRWWIDTRWKHMSEGVLTTDDEGHFRVPVVLTREHLTSDEQMMRFRVKATVTDVAGESHDAEWTVNATDREFALDLTVDDVPDFAKDVRFKVEAFNLNREKVNVQGKYAVMYDSHVLTEGDFTSGDSILLPKNLRLGVNYYIKVSALEKSGYKVVDYASITPYNSSLPISEIARLGTNEKFRPEMDEKEGDFIYTENSVFTEGGAVDLFFTTKETDAFILYTIYTDQGLLTQQMGVTDGTMKHLRLPYQKEWGEGIEVNVFYVRNGRFSRMVKRFELARPEKRLKLEWASFRDRLQPGQQEQWTLTVTDWNGNRVGGAEMMAVLYDASLDRIFSHDWNFGLNFSRFVPSARADCSDRYVFPTFSLAGRSSDGGAYHREYDQLRGFEHDRYLRIGGGVSVLESRAMRVADEEGAAVEDDAMMMSKNMMKVEEEPAVPSEDFDHAVVRENFAETAFFLPHLVSDSKGNVTIQFTLPESLTEWQFMGFAHTKEVDYGLLKAKAVARKDFMLRPNMPRFVRWGDRAVVASSIINQSEKALNGAVRMRLIDPKTDAVVLTMEEAFAVEAGKTIGVNFHFDVKEEWTDLDCEVIAVSGNVSDGEKNHLPVLSTKKAMVETVPYYIIGTANGAEVSKTMDLTKLFNENSSTATNRVLKVEYTDNPAWMCIEALRSVKNPAEDDAIDFAASLYANTRLVELMQTFPVMEKHENRDELQKRVDLAETKLTGLQNSDGGWSWFKGMKSSFYTTLAVCEQLAKLPKPNEKVKQMLMEGMKYLDQYELDSYLAAKKRKVKIWPYDSDIRYLYVSAQMPDRVVSADIKKMRDEYLKKVEKTPRDLTIYGAANTAYTLRAFGRVKSADKFVDFLKDYTVEKLGQGRFYATDAAYYSWMDYRIPTQVAAMKAIWQKDKKDAILNDMQLWLISQKQVQKWDNPMNTIDVADFLLRVSSTETFHESKKPVLVVDGTELKEMNYGTINTERDELEGREANLILEGNVLADVPEEMLKEGVHQLEVKKQTPSISWGSAYATFLEDVGSLKLYATNELKIERKLYVQNAGSDKWVDFDPNQPLKVGDKLRIRHLITADRDMDFVRVSAQHPACLEPLRQLSGYQNMGGRGCYLSIHDSHFDMFFDWFTRGTSTVDMDYSIVREGSYQVGVSTVECVYAKQFGGHTEGMKVNVKSEK